MNNQKRLWFPEIWQVRIRNNSHYLNSVFAGFTCGWFNLPHLLWTLAIKPFWTLVKALFVALVLMPIIGIFGMISPVRCTILEAQREIQQKRS